MPDISSIECVFCQLEALTDAGVKQKLETVKNAGIAVVACNPDNVSRILHTQNNNRLQISLFGATYCSACVPQVEQLINLKERVLEADYHFFPVESSAPDGLHPKVDLGEIVHRFKECTNNLLLEASGWEAEAVPVLVLSGRKDKAVWVQTGYSGQEGMKRMIESYQKGESYEEFVVKDFPLRAAELKTKIGTLGQKSETKYDDWYPFWTGLERDLKFVREHIYTPGIAAKTEGTETIIMPVVASRKTRAIKSLELNLGQFSAFIRAAQDLCGLTEETVGRMRRIIAREQGGSLNREDEAFLQKKENLIITVRRMLEDRFEPVIRSVNARTPLPA